MQIILCPAIVQGEAAVPSIINGIRALERIGVDVMIVGRGGGSIEDLWAFNEREVAETVFQCSVPVISAVGHETDTTIIDFVSDLRAPTPSAAAELAVADIREILGEWEDLKNGLDRAMNRILQKKLDYAERMELRLKALSPASRIRERRMRALSVEDKLQERMHRMLEERRHRLALYVERLKGLSPLGKLNSGYSYVTDADGKNIRSTTQVTVGQTLTIQVNDGNILTKVQQIRRSL